MVDFDKNLIRYISRKRIAHLATSDTSGIPTVIPVCHVYNNGIIYSPLDKKSKKVEPKRLKRVKNILKNPNVSLVIDEYNDNWEKLSYVIIQGKASLIDHGQEYSKSLMLLCEKYEQYREMKLDTLGLPIIKVLPEKVITWGDI